MEGGVLLHLSEISCEATTEDGAGDSEFFP